METTGSQLMSLTCPTCDISVTQPPGTRRTICPHCGSFYDSRGPPHARRLGDRPLPPTGPGPTPPPRPRSRTRALRQLSGPGAPQVEDGNDSRAKHDKSGGRLQSLANFFHINIRAKSGDSSTPSRGRLSVAGSVNGRSSSRGELPPIATESMGRLTVDNPNGEQRSSRPPSGTYSRNSNHDHHGNRGGAPSRNILSRGQTPAKTIRYPDRHKTIEELRADLAKAEETKEWNELHEFYATTFDSFLELNAAFKIDPYKEYKSTDDPGLKFDYIHTVYEVLLKVPQDTQKIVLKAIINSLLKDKRPHSKDDLRAFLILVLNPVFSSPSTYVIFAHLLRQIAALTDHEHHFLVHWFKWIEMTKFRLLVNKLHLFVSCRLFPPKPQELPPMPKCTWWIPSATKVLALLNAANNLSHPPPISHMAFYNASLDHLDLMAEYYTWQNPSAHPGFSFCQYPFILSIAAKRSILQRDSEQQMIIMARRSLVAKVQRRQMPDIGMLFLNLTVRRSHLVADSLNEIARKQHDLKKKLKVTFTGEPGLDMGGLTKEWFLLLIRQIFQEEYGMFTYNTKSRLFWFSSAPCESYQEFNLVGVLMGLAVYNSIILDIHFPAICYKKLLSPAVVPYNNPNASVGVTHVGVEHMRQAMPDLAHGLQELLDYEGDVEEDFGLTYQISITEFGSTRTHSLRANGENIAVTNKNKHEYVQMYCDFLLNKAVYLQFQAFYHGFHSVCASNALIMLRPEEVELLVCGCPDLNMAELKKVASYDGYSAQDGIIKYFWDQVEAMPQEMQKRLLLFTTGSDRIPIGGMAEMSFKISKVNNTDMLPMAHTCFNQLVLPAYRSKKMLKQKLLIAIQNAEGFGIE